jgi:hypothetical protein
MKADGLMRMAGIASNEIKMMSYQRMKGKIIIERQLMKISSEVFVVVIDQIVDL